MTMTSKRQTAAELLAQLQADPAFQARQQERDRKHEETERALRQAEAPLVQALSKVGVQVESVWDLANTKVSYPQAAPVLLDHIERAYPDAVRAGIARALAVSGSRAEWGVLTGLYRKERGRRTKEGLAVAIASNATDDVIGDVIAFARDRTHGTSRVLLLEALERSADPRSLSALKEMGNDLELQKEIKTILGRKKRR